MPVSSASAGTAAKAGPPSAMASLGDSITRGFNTCPWSAPYGDCPERSWSTGDGSVNSQYLRIRALNSAIGGRNYNNGKTGAKVGEMVNQAAAAGVNPVKPELVTVLLGANDACTETEGAMTSIANYRQRLNAGLDQISASMPDARIYVLSIPNIYELWSLGRGTALETTIWNTANICQSMLANPGSTAPADQQRRERVRQRVADYNAQIREACDARPHCRHDDGRVFAARFNLNQVSNLDGFHPNEEGQKYLADVAWAGQFDYGDRTAPAAPALTAGRVPDGVDGWYSAPVAVQAASPSNDTKGTEYALRSGTPAANPTSWTPGPGTAVNVGGTGANELQVRAIDRAGNTSASSTLVVKVDQGAPTLTLNVPAPAGDDGWHVTRPLVAVTASDATSGVAATACTVDSAPVPLTDGKVAITQDGTLELRCTATDKAGNETVRTAALKVDTARPAIVLAQAPNGRNGFWLGNATITYSVATDNAASVVCSAAGETVPVRPEAGSEGRRGELTLTRTTNLLCIATDVAGRTDSDSLNVKIDRSAPTLAIALGATEGANGIHRTSPIPFVVTTGGATSLSCTADGDPLAVAQPTTTTAVTTVLVPGQGAITLSCTDADDAGNETTASHSAQVDSVAPVVTIAQEPDGRAGWWKGPATLSAGASDVNPDTLACTIDGDAAADPSAIAVTGDGTHDVVCTATDRAGNTAAASETVKIDTQAPGLTVTASPDGANGFFATAPAPVSVTATDADEVACTVDGDDVDDVDALAVTGDGTHEVECTATDAAGNAIEATEVVEVDTTAPQVTIAQDPDGRSGWWKGPATASASVADAHPDALDCTVDGKDVDDAGDIAVTGDGTHDVVCTATDRAGNTGTATATVKVDATAPPLVVTATPDGANGFFRTAPAPVGVTATDADEVACTIDGDDVADVDAIEVSGDGTHEVACIATDVAGNETARTKTVKIDTTAPQVTLTHEPDGSGGWWRGQATVAAKVADTHADALTCTVDGTTVAGTGLERTLAVSGDGDHDVRCVGTDAAGNDAAAQATVKIDGTAPGLTLTSAPDGDAGWFRTGPARVGVDSSDPAAAVVCTLAGEPVTRDAESRVAVAADGVREVACTATDPAGNPTAKSATVKLDTAAPAAPTAQVDRAPEALGWHRDTVTLTWAHAGDAGGPGVETSGIAQADVPAAQTVTADGTTDLTQTVRDRAGNVSAAATYRVRVDAQASTAKLTCPTGALAKDTVATAALDASDTGSGVVDVPAAVALDTATGGEKEARIVVRDRVGHETVATCAYRVDAPGPSSMPDAPAAPRQPTVTAPITVTPSPSTASTTAPSGANGIAGGTSATRPGLARLTLTFTPKKAKQGRRLRVTVKLTPAQAARPRVAIERRVKGKWRRVKVVRLDRTGRATTTVTSAGGDKLRARLLK